MTTIPDALAAYEDGDLMDGEALRALADEYRQLEDAIGPLDARRKALRQALERITANFGGKAQAGGYDLTITAGGETTSYDAKACDALMARLVANGLFGPAEELAAARNVTRRAASLRITNERTRR